MKRITIVIILFVGASLISGAPAEAHQHRIRDHTRVWRCSSSHDWRRVSARPGLVRCLAWRFNSPGSASYALQIGYCESGSDLQDTYGGDGHIGTYQHVTGYWFDRWHHWGEPLAVPNNGANVLTNVVVSVRMARSMGSWAEAWSCA